MEEATKFTKAYCSCGLTWDTRRSQARESDRVQIIRRSIRRHVDNPTLDGSNTKVPHIVTEIQTSINVYS